jgi:hypothetical protein
MMAKKKQSLNTRLKKRKTKKSLPPAWGGPEKEGVTQSMLGSYLCCKERFRLRVIDGLATPEGFNHLIEYGNMWHECEEAYAGEKEEWGFVLLRYTKKLCKQYPLQQEQILHWYNVCLVQFPHYINAWKTTKEDKYDISLFQEEKFEVPYKLPSGRIILLRGKWDEIKLKEKGINNGLWLKENKTKGTIDEEKMVKQLSFDLQTMTYQVALQTAINLDKPDTSVGELPFFPRKTVKGILYNVIRRPLSGGVGSIRRHKATKTKPEETAEHFYGRLSDIIGADPSYFFMRWSVSVSQKDIERFKTQTLDPLLENLVDDYEWWSQCLERSKDPFNHLRRQIMFPNHYNRHFRLPYGVYNPVAEGRTTSTDEYLRTGSKTGLVRNTNLFPELE